MTVSSIPALIFGVDFVDTGLSANDRITNDNSFSLDVINEPTSSSVDYQFSVDAGSTWVSTTANQANLADGDYQFRSLVTYGYEFGFSGDFALANWAMSIGGDGSISANQDIVTLFGADNGDPVNNNIDPADNSVDLTISSSLEYRATFQWEYSTVDFLPFFDSFGYLINGTFYQLTDDFGSTNQSGYVSLLLAAGDLFGFRQSSVDSTSGRATTIISDFETIYSSIYTNVEYLTIDTTAPEAPELSLASDTGVSSTDGITNNGTLNIDNLEALASFQYSTNGGDGWSIGIESSLLLASGSYAAGSILVSQTDVAGNASVNGQLGAITIDTTVAAAPRLALASDTGASNSDGITNKGTVNVSGLEAGASWQYSINCGGTWLTGTGSSFSLAPGNYGAGSIVVRQIDIAGNASALGQLGAITIDTTKPVTTAAITAVADNVGFFQGTVNEFSGTDDATPSLSGTISAALRADETLGIYNGNTFLGNATVNSATKRWSFTPAALPNTSGVIYAITARVTDVAGNYSQSPIRYFFLDTAASATTTAITSVADNFGTTNGFLANGAVTDDITPTISGSLSAPLATGETLRLYNGNKYLGLVIPADGVTTWSYASYLADGFYSITARVVDAVGNIGAASAAQKFSVDSTSSQLIGNAGANTLTATGSKDLITGLGGVDTFQFTSLAKSNLANFDRITDFTIGTDILDGPTAVSAANINKLGSVAALDAQSISTVLTSSYFAANKAATFSYADSSGTLRSFIALNNGVAGFSASTDAIVEITGYIGSLNNLQII
jgi:hypothetical protein